MIKGYQEKLMNIYEKIREDENHNLKNRKNEILQKAPEIIELDNTIQKLSLALPMAILKGASESDLNNIKADIQELRKQKYELLTAYGYPTDYLTLHYQCPKCQDTGYIGTKRCSCFKTKLVNLYYETSKLSNNLATCNFNNFDIRLFSSENSGNYKNSQRKNMEKIYEFVRGNYLANFDTDNTNLLFYGESGNGKTFLSWCIAKELLDKGYLVIYKTSNDLIRDLREITFNNNYVLEDLLINCDLLIIDDLGAEQVTDFSTNELFNLINKKLLNNKKMIISTNLNLPDIEKSYTTRVYSRLVGNFTFFKFYGNDVRIKLNLARMRSQQQ
ncbi:ATP-binding protein [Clostridium sp. NSJ-49]|uniref:ATP-binding protein n=2 Tax=Clostridium TaxID=1485 RepID=UPI00164CD9F6|nr:ATP-binding protein [Clostridium sp. NSJ-49]MBC5625195.1 ATP-binding protein [Clostridium sp. NSJ-49]